MLLLLLLLFVSSFCFFFVCSISSDAFVKRALLLLFYVTSTPKACPRPDGLCPASEACLAPPPMVLHACARHPKACPMAIRMLAPRPPMKSALICKTTSRRTSNRPGAQPRLAVRRTGYGCTEARRPKVARWSMRGVSVYARTTERGFAFGL